MQLQYGAVIADTCMAGFSGAKPPGGQNTPSPERQNPQLTTYSYELFQTAAAGGSYSGITRSASRIFFNKTAP